MADAVITENKFIKCGLCGLVGHPLGHSFSPQIHSLIGGYEYRLFDLQPEQLADFFGARNFSAVNVTIPYKTDVMKYCDRISREAQIIGSVNTVVKEKDGTLSGYNTDYFGFKSMVEKAGINVWGKKAVVLGSGGSSRTVVAVLRDFGASETVVISRSGPDNYLNISKHSDARIIVNTTPCGMYPRNGEKALSLSVFTDPEGVCDIVYNPEKTALLLEAEKLRIPYAGGLYMLVAQAVKAAEFFFDTVIDGKKIDSIYRKINFGMRNITLVGMPGCGKSTVGRFIASLTGKKFFDCDDYITEKTGATPEEIIRSQGEAGFRSIETEALAELTRMSGAVISCGGGAVTVPENIPLLRQNGKVVYLEREIAELETKGRPLSEGGREVLVRMLEKRDPLYREASDFSVRVCQTPELTAKKILEYLD